MHKVLKFHDFSVTQILCEINFAESKSSKTPVLAFLGALKMIDFVKFCIFSKVEIDQMSEIQSPKNDKNGNFRTFRFCKIDFT